MVTRTWQPRYSDTTVTETIIGNWRIWKETSNSGAWKHANLYFDNTDGEAGPRYVRREIYLGLHKPAEAAKVIRNWRNAIRREKELERIRESIRNADAPIVNGTTGLCENCRKLAMYRTRRGLCAECA